MKITANVGYQRTESVNSFMFGIPENPVLGGTQKELHLKLLLVLSGVSNPIIAYMMRSCNRNTCVFLLPIFSHVLNVLRIFTCN